MVISENRQRGYIRVILQVHTYSQDRIKFDGWQKARANYGYSFASFRFRYCIILSRIEVLPRGELSYFSATGCGELESVG
jgi:hypothetical protein